MSLSSGRKWDWEIGFRTSYWDWNLKELWSYRDLLLSFVRRDFLLNYQQTILGPLWILFQPLMTLITYLLVFGKLVGISTGAIPPVLFYFSGIVLWNFFNDSFANTSNVFRDNSHLFGKVFFPRLIVPIASVSTQFMRFLVQFATLMILIATFVFFQDFSLNFNVWLLAVPLSIIMIGMIALGSGLIFSVLTAKYRDINNLVMLIVRLLMFFTPVIYPLSTIPEQYRWIVAINPLSALFEVFRIGLLGQGSITPFQLVYSTVFTLVVFFSGILIFNKQSDKLIDVI